MLSSNNLLGASGPLAALLPGYQVRPGQQEFAAVIERAVHDGKVALVEAGCGAGKSLGAIAGVASAKSIIYAVGSRALRDQVYQEADRIAALLDCPEEQVCLLRARADYVCFEAVKNVRKLLAVALGKGESLDSLRALLALVDAGETSVDAFSSFPVSEWERISAEGTFTHKCQHPLCPYTGAKVASDHARITICTHDLYLLDAKLRASSRAQIAVAKREGKKEPPMRQCLPDHTTVIFDEAHLLGAAVGRQLGYEVNFDSLLKTIDRVTLSVAGNESKVREYAESAVETLQLACRKRQQGYCREPEVLDGACEQVEGWLASLFRQTLPDDPKAKPIKRAASMMRAWRALSDNPGRIPSIESKGLKISPVTPASFFAANIWTSVESAVLMSATLRTLGSFASALKDYGLKAEDTLQHQTPDAFSKAQRCLFRPLLRAKPNTPEYLRESRQIISGVITRLNGNTLLLCASYEDCRHYSDYLRMQGHSVLEQTCASDVPSIKKKFAEGGHVLCGVDSLWVGLDVGTPALQCVIVPRLPFPTTSDPVYAALQDKASAHYDADAFNSYYLPIACNKLMQGVGRAVRNHKQHSLVVLLDPRIHPYSPQKKPYQEKVRKPIEELCCGEAESCDDFVEWLSLYLREVASAA